MAKHDELIEVDDVLRRYYPPLDTLTIEDAAHAKRKLVRDMLAEGTMTEEEAKRFGVDAQSE